MKRRQTINRQIKFGTDGWRGVIAEDFTFYNVRLCAQGISDYIKANVADNPTLVIGYDNRFASEDFASATAEVISGNGIKVLLSPNAVPTPVVSFNVIERNASGGIAITASHNPAGWNGFKFRTENGTSVSSEIIAELEKHIYQAVDTDKTTRLSLPEAQRQELLEYPDFTSAYFERLRSLINPDSIRKEPLKVIIDYMYGACSGYLKHLLQGGNIEIIEINNERNPAFPGINPEPIAANLGKLSGMVKEQKADIGIAIDGDGDRIGIVDEKGNFLTQLQVFALLCLYLLEIRGERGTLVKTITTTSMIDRLGELFSVPVHETSVGFKYVAPVMVAENALIGGEESGGYGFRGHIPERDAMPAILYFLDFMIKTGKTPSSLLEYLYSKVGPHYYDRIDLEFPEAARLNIIERVKNNFPSSIDGTQVLRVDITDGFRFILTDGTWLLVRFSGTEPILRIYTESDSMERVSRLLRYGRELTGI